MSAFAKVTAALPRAPERVVALAPEAFASNWPGRPDDPVDVGLRIPSDHDLSSARAEAARIALKLHPHDADVAAREQAMADALIREICALVMCDPLNVALPYFPAQADDVREKLTSEGAKRVFDEFEQLVIETSPVHAEASDDEVEFLGTVLAVPDCLDVLELPARKRARRLIRFLLDQLEPE